MTTLLVRRLSKLSIPTTRRRCARWWHTSKVFLGSSISAKGQRRGWHAGRAKRSRGEYPNVRRGRILPPTSKRDDPQRGRPCLSRSTRTLRSFKRAGEIGGAASAFFRCCDGRDRACSARISCPLLARGCGSGSLGRLAGMLREHASFLILYCELIGPRAYPSLPSPNLRRGRS
jgi:hypothetical protein